MTVAAPFPIQLPLSHCDCRNRVISVNRRFLECLPTILGGLRANRKEPHSFSFAGHPPRKRSKQSVVSVMAIFRQQSLLRYRQLHSFHWLACFTCCSASVAGASLVILG